MSFVTDASISTGEKRRQAANPLPQDENSLRKQTPHVRHSDPTTPADNEKEAGGGGGGVC